MKINDIVDIHNEITMNEGAGLVRKSIRKVDGLNWARAKRMFKKSFGIFANTIETVGFEEEVLKIINDNLGTRFRSLDSILRMKILESNDEMNEGLSTWWKEAAGNLYGALSFYPILTMFLELDKIIRGMDGDMKIAAIYGLMWVGIVSGKVAKDKIVGVRKDKAEKKNHVKASLHPAQTGR